MKMKTGNSVPPRNGWKSLALILGYVGSFLGVSFWAVGLIVGMAYNHQVFNKFELGLWLPLLGLIAGLAFVIYYTKHSVSSKLILTLLILTFQLALGLALMFYGIVNLLTDFGDGVFHIGPIALGSSLVILAFDVGK